MLLLKLFVIVTNVLKLMPFQLFFADVRECFRIVSLGLFRFLFIVQLSFFGCNKPKPASLGPSGEWKMTFAQRLPHDKPDVCLQLIKDSLALLDDQTWACENIMFNASDMEKNGLVVYQ